MITVLESEPPSASISYRGRDCSTYRVDIDGLRALSVLLVLAYHAFPSLASGGFIGVDVFFVISGYLIGGILLQSMRTGSFSVGSFYARRVRRIFPALAIVLSVSLLAGWFLLFANEYRQLGRQVAGSAAFVANLIDWGDAGYFDAAKATKPLLHIWSLGIEEQFYVVAPLILWAGSRLRRGPILVIVFVLVTSLFYNLQIAVLDRSADFYSPLSRAWELMAGAFVSQLPGVAAERGWRAAGWVRDAASVAGTLLVAAAVWSIDGEAPFPGWRALVPVLGAALVIGAGRNGIANRFVLSGSTVQWLGRISYPLYLWHWPLLSFATIVAGASLTPRTSIALLIASVVLAWATFRFVEMPARSQSSPRRVVGVLAAAMVCVAVAGAAVYMQDGLAARRINDASILLADLSDIQQQNGSDGSCPLLLRIPEVKDGECRTNSARPALLVIGDSHALALTSAAYNGAARLGVVTIASHGCLPFPRFVQSACSDMLRSALAAASALTTVRTVILANAGGSTYFAKEYADTGGKVSATRAMLEGYSEVIRRLLDTGKTVVFVRDVPTLDFDVRACIPRGPIPNAHARAGGCGMDREVVDAGNRDYRPLLDALASRFPMLLFYDPAPLFCSDRFCRARTDQHLLYFDSNHLDLAGSGIVLNDFRNWLVSMRIEPGLPDAIPAAARFTRQVSDSPRFDVQGSWSSGYRMAISHGDGVVVGPGTSAANVFAQRFAAWPGQAFEVVASASSVADAPAMARIQVNWSDAHGTFLSESGAPFLVERSGRSVTTFIVAPPDAASGMLYVVPGDGKSIVRYREMRLMGEEPTAGGSLNALSTRAHSQ